MILCTIRSKALLWHFFEMYCLTAALNNAQLHAGYHIINILTVGFKNQNSPLCFSFYCRLWLSEAKDNEECYRHTTHDRTRGSQCSVVLNSITSSQEPLIQKGKWTQISTDSVSTRCMDVIYTTSRCKILISITTALFTPRLPHVHMWSS